MTLDPHGKLGGSFSGIPLTSRVRTRFLCCHWHMSVWELFGFWPCGAEWRRNPELKSIRVLFGCWQGCCAGVHAKAPVNLNEVDLSHFNLLKVVGRGGFGKVNAVEKVRIAGLRSCASGCLLQVNAKGEREGQLMALKRMDKYSVVQKQSHIDMVWVERRIMSRLHSPFLCSLVGAAVPGQRIAFWADHGAALCRFTRSRARRSCSSSCPSCKVSLSPC